MLVCRGQGDPVPRVEKLGSGHGFKVTAIGEVVRL